MVIPHLRSSRIVIDLYTYNAAYGAFSHKESPSKYKTLQIFVSSFGIFIDMFADLSYYAATLNHLVYVFILIHFNISCKLYKSFLFYQIHLS